MKQPDRFERAAWKASGRGRLIATVLCDDVAVLLRRHYHAMRRVVMKQRAALAIHGYTLVHENIILAALDRWRRG